MCCAWVAGRQSEEFADSDSEVGNLAAIVELSVKVVKERYWKKIEYERMKSIIWE